MVGMLLTTPASARNAASIASALPTGITPPSEPGTRGWSAFTPRVALASSTQHATASHILSRSETVQVAVPHFPPFMLVPESVLEPHPASVAFFLSSLQPDSAAQATAVSN